ncbi:hypothetical protein B0H34DRAFT_109930 [Crassisporium funariophilum]|nr:hypothetical protein B0H34DRAFT_109930 [Crassisporium funariophilum]
MTSKIDQHLEIHLPKYQVDQSLQDLVVLAAGAAFYPRAYAEIDFWKDLEAALANKNLIQVDRKGLSLLTYLHRTIPTLAASFRDPLRCGKLFVTGGQIAALALRCMKSAVSNYQKLKMLQDQENSPEPGEMETNCRVFLVLTVVHLLRNASPSKDLALYMEQPDIRELLEVRTGNAYTKYLVSTELDNF